MKPFVVCLHDASPVWAREIGAMLDDLAPLVGRRLAAGVVPDWHERWPLAAHPDFCGLLRERADELLLHGRHHRRRRGGGPVSLLAERSDEMNGLNPGETREALDQGQRAFADAFGTLARGFLAPAWQRGHVRPGADAHGLRYSLGYGSIAPAAGRPVPLATFTWDCGRWAWLGHLGHGLGRLAQAFGGRVPVLAIHPRDVARGYWPAVLRLTRELLAAGHVPTTPARLLEPRC